MFLVWLLKWTNAQIFKTWNVLINTFDYLYDNLYKYVEQYQNLTILTLNISSKNKPLNKQYIWQRFKNKNPKKHNVFRTFSVFEEFIHVYI